MSFAGFERHHHLPQALLLEWDSRRHGIAKYGDWPHAGALEHSRKLGVAVEPDAVAGVPGIHPVASVHKAVVDQQRGAARVEARLAQHIAPSDLVPAAAKAL